MYIKRILLIIVLVGVVVGGIFAYTVYSAIFSPNTAFENKEAYLLVRSDATFEDVKKDIAPLLEDVASFISVAERKDYVSNIKPGHFVIKKGMNNNDIINTIRSKNKPVKIAFNNQERIEDLAGRIATQIEADSLSLLLAMKDPNFLKVNGFTDQTALTMYIPNSYELYWNISAKGFRDRMLKEHKRFWNDTRMAKAKLLKMTPEEVYTVASIVHKETAKVEERPRVAGVYLNRINKGIKLDADPTIIFALKKKADDWDMVIKRVLYKDLEIESPYNTYRNAGIPPGPIFMPDISAIDAVLNAEKHSYYYFVADIERFGYHKFAKTLSQHNANSAAYKRWISNQGVRR
ncbi:endolytic transglycosylase MltG [uncultured Dokdonia sp.]|uniref:endolytic transglycosylase MltG n=1 Tax=uncultured Dokdonia sp. TaxID=575653 RepID=UPI0026178C76|nr:endolytic transglycosylase MltG [uncultured Dokdonia sp.]